MIVRLRSFRAAEYDTVDALASIGLSPLLLPSSDARGLEARVRNLDPRSLSLSEEDKGDSTGGPEVSAT